MRFTKDIIPKVLAANEGFKVEKNFNGRNEHYSNTYFIKDGKMFKRSSGKTSWADSRYDETTECDIDQTRTVLRENKNRLNLNI